MANKKHKGSENLKSIRSTEEAKRMGHNGGVASGVSRRKKRDAREAISLVLSLAVSKSLEPEMKEMGLKEEDWTNMNALAVEIFLDAMNGDKDARKMLLDYGGFNLDYVLREKESEARIVAMQNASAANADDDGIIEDVHIYMPENGRDGE